MFKNKMWHRVADKLRMAEWLAVAGALLAILAYTAPAQIPVVGYKILLVTFFAFLGYWIDRTLFPSGRLTTKDKPVSSAETQSAWLRRAIIVGSVILAGALAL